ncbi:MAG: 5-(carboxyamino)imidazole ribonucleotide synthase [Opitutae bacterium]
MSHCVLPGGTLGVLGSGQLGRMFAIAARRLGYRIHVLSPESDTPTGQVADKEIQASYQDLKAVEDFAAEVDVVTFEFENVDSQTVEAIERNTRVHPAGRVLHTTQHRLREKNFLQSISVPVTPFAAIRSQEDLENAASTHAPGVLKTAAWGYDGKGQVKVEVPTDAIAAWEQIDRAEAIFEKFVDFNQELSIVAARGQDGECAFYGPMANLHENHILSISVCPGGFSEKVTSEAQEITRAILEALNYVGTLCVEFFLTQDGSLLVNELAPRPHNSGHLTIDGHRTCQFEQQVRAIAGLPLGSPAQIKPAAMVNLLGDVWQNGDPDWSSALAINDLKLHLYGKREARVGRKMGHINILSDTPESAKQLAVSALQSLKNNT